MSKKLVIFDLDGTLLNTIGDLAACCNHMLRQRGLEEHSYEEYCHFVGNGVTRLVERALPELLRTTDYIAAARKDFVEYYYDNIDNYTVAYNGVHELLKKLSDAGATLAVASNKFHSGTNRLIEKFFGDIEFAAIYGNRDGFPLKPDRAIIDLIMEQCGATADNTYMVGDSGIDIQTARAAGVHSIGVSWGFRDRQELVESGAEYIADNTEELFDAIFG
ncbi:MAG: HAD-IA family hydrolase [Alistipes sp.]|nr:HAD-IA family hydrolase [Alistipes sp.]MBQ9962638.1 HAD-IA family hydrolase [Alistipes sp.]